MSRPRHTAKEIEEAVQYAEGLGWTVRMQGHWARLYCAHHDREGCQVGVSGTPRSAGNHARQIRRMVDRCPHASGGSEEAGDGDI